MKQVKKAEPKFIVNYTEKPYRGVKSEGFQSKSAAKLWIKRKKKLLYWTEVVHAFAESKKPRPIVKFELDDSFIAHEGTLNTHFETGMEYLGLIFELDGIHGPPNPNFNSALPEGGSNFKNFASYDAMIFIKHGHILLLPTGEKVGMIKDREFATDDNYRLSFYPQGFSRAELLKLFCPGNVKATLWIKK